MRELSITVLSEVINQTGEKNVIELYSMAQYEQKEESQYLIYEETELSGMEGTKTMLKYDGHILTIKRFGNVSSLLKIEPSAIHENSYKTPYGVFTMITEGHKIIWENSPLEIVAEYDLEIVGNEEKARFIIAIKENRG